MCDHAAKPQISLRMCAVWSEPLLVTRITGPRSAVGNVSGNRYESDCRSRGREFDPGPVPYFRGDFSALPLNHSRRVVVSYKRKYVHELLVNCLFKLAQEKVWLGELTVPQ